MTYKDIILSDNPIAYWPLDEVSGRTAFDATSNHHDGTYVGFNFSQNQPTFLGPSLKFNPTSYITVPDFTVIYPLTFELWFNNLNNNIASVLFSKFDQNAAIGFTLDIAQSRQVALRLTPGYFTFSHNSYANSVWHYIVIIIDSSGNVIFYIDGIEITTSTVSGSLYNNESLTIGTDATRYFLGYMMHFAIYDYVLSTKQIDNHRNIPYISSITCSRTFDLVAGMRG